MCEETKRRRRLVSERKGQKRHVEKKVWEEKEEGEKMGKKENWKGRIKKGKMEEEE